MKQYTFYALIKPMRKLRQRLGWPDLVTTMTQPQGQEVVSLVLRHSSKGMEKTIGELS